MGKVIDAIAKLKKDKLICKLYFGHLYELNLIEEYLEKMAAKGLMFVKKIGPFYYFKECDPQKIKFCVDPFSKAYVWSKTPDEDSEEYIEYCKECGWEFIFSRGKLHYFFTREANPVSIQTDETIKLDMLNDHIVKTLWIWFIIYCYKPLNVFWEMHISTNLFFTFSEMNITDLLVLGISLLFYIELIRYLIFYIKNKLRLKKNLSIKYVTNTEFILYSTIMKFLVIFIYISIFYCYIIEANNAFLLNIIIVVFIFLVVIFSLRKSVRKLNIFERCYQSAVIAGFLSAIIMVLLPSISLKYNIEPLLPNYEYGKYWRDYYDEELNLPLVELGLVSQDDKNFKLTANSMKSPLCYESRVCDALPMMNGEEDALIVHVKKAPIIKLLEEDIKQYKLKSYTIRPEKASEEEVELWGAEEVYVLGGRLVIYKDSFIYISSWRLEYNERTISLIREALLP